MERSELAAVPKDHLLLLALLLVTGIIYLRSLGNGFVFDDNLLIVGNYYLGDWNFLWRSLFRDEYWFKDPIFQPNSSRYRPLLLIWFALSYHLFGLWPPGWHAMMIPVHLICVWLTWKIAARLTGRSPAALLAAALFALAPIHADAVVWPGGFAVSLSSAFALGAFYFMMQRRKGPSGHWPPALLCYAGALLTFEGAIAFPVLVAGYVFVFESEEADSSVPPPSLLLRARRALVYASPFLAELLVYLVIRKLVLGFVTSEPPLVADRAYDMQVAATIPLVMVTYLALLAMPWRAAPFHRVLLVDGPATADFYLPLALLLLLAASLWWLLRDHRRHRLSLFCLLWIAIAIAPMLDLFAFFRDQFVHDVYLYLPSVAWCILLAHWATEAAAGSALRRRLTWTVVAAALGIYAVALWRVQGQWHDDLTLFTNCIERFPESATCHHELGVRKLASNDIAGGEAELKRASDLAPNSPDFLYHLALADAQLGRRAEAVSETASAIAMRPAKRFPAHYAFLAKMYDAQGDATRAESVLKRLGELPHGAQEEMITRAQIRMAHGDAPGAETILRGGLERFPEEPDLWAQLGNVLGAQRRPEDALVVYQRALELAPEMPLYHFLAAQALHTVGRDHAALAQCDWLLERDPHDEGAVRALVARITRARRERP